MKVRITINFSYISLPGLSLMFLLFFNIGSEALKGQTCPNMSTFCNDVPLTCGANNLNNSNCTLYSVSDYIGDRCNELCTRSAHNQVHYAFVTNGSKLDIVVTTSNCSNEWGYNPGLDLGVSTACCGGTSVSCVRSPTPIPPNYQLKMTLPNPVPCKIYYMDLDGFEASVCDYTINVTGGNAPLPLVLKNINNNQNNRIDISLGACAYKFTVEPKNEPCEGFYEWTFDGTLLNDFDREVKLDFPDEGDFTLCVKGYIGIPTYNCGQSNLTCTTIRVKKDQFYAGPRVLCNELIGYKWYQHRIYSSGVYKQELMEKCHVFDSIVEFILLPKPQPGIVNYISCSRSDPYFDPVHKEYYRNCTAHKKINVPKSTEVYGCDSSYILNVAFVDLKNTFHLRCKNGNVYMVPDLINYTDTCGLGIQMNFSYSWYEKLNNNIQFISHGPELIILRKGNYQLQVLTQYALGTEVGSCVISFDEDIDEDSYLSTPNTGSILGKMQVCKADIECYSINDIVKNPYSFTWSVDQGFIITLNPDTAKRVCVQWDKTSTMMHGKICATYSDSCSSNLQACLEIEFGKSLKEIAGPDQKIGGVLGTKMNAQGKKGLWTYAGGPGSVNFTDPTDPKTRVRVTRFGSYIFKWTTLEGDCEVYDSVTVNFYLEFPQLEGEYYKPFYKFDDKEYPIKKINTEYLDHQLKIQGELKFSGISNYIIFNGHGTKICNGTFMADEKEFTHSFYFDSAPGLYYLVLKNDAGISVSKFLIVR